VIFTLFETSVLTIDQEKKILEDFVSEIPSHYMGPERVDFIVKNADNISDQDKMVLKEFINKSLTMMIESEASDIEIGGHGNEGYIWMRIHGVKERVKDLPQFTEDESATIIVNLFNENQRRHLLENRNLDFSYTYFYEKRKLNVRFRADAYFDLDTLSMNMRLINLSVRPLASLEFHPLAVRSLSHNYIKFGLTLITGITGSGKSTTLDSIIDHHNKFDPAHVIIIAAPIEYVHTSNVSLVKHREVGRDVPTFKDGIVQALRQDPDIIVVGEMRDADTIMAALEVTDTGHKVFSTLHTSSATESLDRIIAEVNELEQDRVRNRLADVLISVVSQKLVPTIDGKRIMAKEVMVITPSIKAAIKNNNTSEIYMMINQGGAQGMITMEQDLKRLYMEKRITRETAIVYANNKTRIQQILSAK
jgi:twitching motility protein PilT